MSTPLPGDIHDLPPSIVTQADSLPRSAGEDSWPPEPASADWLRAEARRLVDFARAARHPEGGFGWLDSSGDLDSGHPVELWVTSRMTHVFALGDLLGEPGCAPLVDHGIRALEGRLRDMRHGGWFAAVDADGPLETSKEAYGHAFVVLAASSAAVSGHPRAATLLDDALATIDRHFWSETQGMVLDRFDESFTAAEPYRGVNANMHTVEAFLAASDVTRDPAWRIRALRITERVIDFAQASNWRIPEHYDEKWTPLLDYNESAKADQFRPYGATPGHGLEWARLALNLRAALSGDAPNWLLPAAQELFARAVGDGWQDNGAPGFVYTTDWDGTPVIKHRLHWVAAEATATAAALYEATGEERYAAWYRRWWSYIQRFMADPNGGSWWHELDEMNNPSQTIWPGKPDVYHALQAALVPQLPLAPTFASALALTRG